MKDFVDKTAFQHIAKIYQDIIAISDSTGRIIYANELFYERTGYERSDVENGDVFASQLYERGEREAYEISHRVMKERKIQEYSTRLRGKQGNSFDIDLTVVGLFLDRRKPQFVIGINRSVIALERLIAELDKVNDDFKETDFLNDPEKYIIILTDAKGRILYCNKSTIDMLGYRYEEIMSRNVEDFYVDGKREALRVLVPTVKAYREKQHPTNLIWQNSFLLHKQGTPVPVKIAFRIYYGADERGVIKRSSILGINQDLTQLRRMGFISYCSEDRAKVTKLRESLECLQMQLWMDIRDIPVSSVIDSEVKKGIQASDYFFFFMTPNSVKSDWCLGELKIALDAEKNGTLKVVPILLEQCDVPVPIESKKYADFTKNPASGLSNLVQFIRPDLEHSECYMAFKNIETL